MGKGSRRIRSAKPKPKKNTVIPGSAILNEPLSDIVPIISDEDWKKKVGQELFLLEDRRQSSLELIYGKKGLPDGVSSPILDHLGNPLRKKETLTVAAKTLTPEEKEAIGERRVTLLRDHTLDYPDLFLSVFVQPDPSVSDDESRFALMFGRTGSKRAKSVLEADLVVFAGGSDVSPVLYGEEPHATTYESQERDDSDIALYLLCREHGIPMFGVCRGAQFLHVMNGGKLYQDVDGHLGPHGMLDHKNKIHINRISSVHHQMVKENLKGGMEIIATAAESKNRWSNPKTMESGEHNDIEAFFYPDTCCIGVQGHPEYVGYSYYTKWCMDLINDLVCCNPDVELVDGFRRIDPNLEAMRASIIEQAVVSAKKGNK